MRKILSEDLTPKELPSSILRKKESTQESLVVLWIGCYPQVIDKQLTSVFTYLRTRLLQLSQPVRRTPDFSLVSRTHWVQLTVFRTTPRILSPPSSCPGLQGPTSSVFHHSLYLDLSNDFREPEGPHRGQSRNRGGMSCQPGDRPPRESVQVSVVSRDRVGRCTPKRTSRLVRWIQVSKRVRRDHIDPRVVKDCGSGRREGCIPTGSWTSFRSSRSDMSSREVAHRLEDGRGGRTFGRQDCPLWTEVDRRRGSCFGLVPSTSLTNVVLARLLIPSKGRLVYTQSS